MEYLKARHYEDKYNQMKIQKDLIGRLFYFQKKKYKIDEILFDRYPCGQTLNVNGKSVKIIDYYLLKFKLDIQNKDQPLILTKKKGPQKKF